MYYIAYGSNLNSNVRKENNNNFKFIKTYKLYGYELAFKKYKREYSYLTIDENENSYVDVAIYEIDNEDEKRLDYYEDVENDLYYKYYIDIDINNKLEKCLVYIMNKDAKYALPNDDYLNKVIFGFKELGFDENSLKNALKKTK